MHVEKPKCQKAGYLFRIVLPNALSKELSNKVEYISLKICISFPRMGVSFYF